MRTYLDTAASAPLRGEVRAYMAAVLELPLGNPSSLHARGRAARRIVEEAREEVVTLIAPGCFDAIFTGSGSEANNLALRGAVDAAPGGEAVLMAVGAAEHPSVIETARALERAGRTRFMTIAVDGSGRVTPCALEEALDHRPWLVSVQYVNNETGVIQDLAAIAQRCRRTGVLLHVDAVQAAGLLPLDPLAEADYVTISAHKFGGPPGVGVLFMRPDAPIRAQVAGGGQEGTRRAGTENLCGIAGLGVAARLARAERSTEAPRIAALRAEFERRLTTELGAVIHGADAPRAPHIISAAFPGSENEALLRALDAAGVAASAGAACSSGAVEPSPVLRAMKVPYRLIQASLRFSLGVHNGEADIDHAVFALSAVLKP